MNDEDLNAELANLFGADTHLIDPKLPGAVALIERVTSEQIGSDQESGEPPFVADVVELGSSEPAPKRGRLLLVAAVVVLAVIVVGRFVLPNTDESPVISNEFDFDDPDLDVNGTAEIMPTAFIVGPQTPHIIIDDSDLNADPFEPCLGLPGQEFDPLTEGSAALGFAFGIAGERSSWNAWVVESEISTVTCAFVPDAGSVVTFVPPFQQSVQDRPLVFESQGQLSQEPDSNLIGLLADDVVEVRHPDIPEDQQEFQRFGRWFRLSFEGGFPAEFEIELTDGSIISQDEASGTFSNADPLLTTRCTTTECVADELADLESEAREAGAQRQASLLESGVLSQVEYDFAEAAFLRCVAGRTDLALNGSEIIDADSREASAAIECYESEISFIESARRAQNGLFFGPDPELVALTEAAEAIFADGLERAELDLRAGFLSAVEEREERIDTFFEDFDWIGGDVVVEGNLLEDTVTNVVTVWPQGDPARAAAFVVSGELEDLVIARIPTLEDRELEVLSGIPPTDDGELIVRPTGRDGFVQAFIAGESVEAGQAFLADSSTIFLPADLPPDSVLTFVYATGNVPRVAVLHLE